MQAAVNNFKVLIFASMLLVLSISAVSDTMKCPSQSFDEPIPVGAFGISVGAPSSTEAYFEALQSTAPHSCGPCPKPYTEPCAQTNSWTDRGGVWETTSSQNPDGTWNATVTLVIEGFSVRVTCADCDQ